jgi:type I restriction enzyme S subunit
VRDRFNDLGPRLSLKRRWQIIDCKHRTPAYVDEGYSVTSPGDLSPGRIDLSRCHRFVDDADFGDLTEGRRPKRGDIIYSRNASAGIAAYVDTDQPFCMGQDVCLITSSDQEQRFLMYALNTIGADQLAPIKIGSTITRRSRTRSTTSATSSIDSCNASTASSTSSASTGKRSSPRP